MPREIKVTLFSCILMIALVSIVGKWIETGSLVDGLIFFLQVAGTAIVFIGGFLFFVWIGSLIWRE